MKHEIPAFYRKDSSRLQFIKVWIEFMQKTEYYKVFADFNNSYNASYEMDFIYTTLKKIVKNKKRSPKKYAFTLMSAVKPWKYVYNDAFKVVFNRQSKIPYKWWDDNIDDDIIRYGLSLESFYL